jgi:hypothetical protein
MLAHTVRPMLSSALFYPLILALAACGPRVRNENIDALNAQFEAAKSAGKSLSIKEVESILGQPNRTETGLIEQQTTKEMQMVRYYYEEGGRTIELHFLENKLVDRAVHFGEKPSGDAPLRMPPKGGGAK